MPATMQPMKVLGPKTRGTVPGPGQTGFACLHLSERSAEACACNLLAKILTVHFYHDAHFRKARAHTLADPVAEGFIAAGATGSVTAVRGAGRQVGIIRRDDGRALVVVARIQNERDRVPNPVGGLRGAELVKDEDLRFENGLQDLHFRGRHLWVVGVLDLLEQFAVVAEEAAYTFFENEGVQNADGQVSCADADGARNQQAASFGRDRIAIHELARDERGRGQRSISFPETGIVAIERTMLIARGNGG